MNKILLSLILLVSTCLTSFAQNFNDKHLSVGSKGDLIVLTVTQGTGSYSSYLEELKIHKGGKQLLIDAMKKGLSWSIINKSQHLSFSKLVAQIGSINITFNGSTSGGYSIALFKSYHDYTPDGSRKAFDIDVPGMLFWQFTNEEQTQQFISALEKETPNLDELFK